MKIDSFLPISWFRISWFFFMIKGFPCSYLTGCCSCGGSGRAGAVDGAARTVVAFLAQRRTFPLNEAFDGRCRRCRRRRGRRYVAVGVCGRRRPRRIRQRRRRRTAAAAAGPLRFFQLLLPVSTSKLKQFRYFLWFETHFYS